MIHDPVEQGHAKNNSNFSVHSLQLRENTSTVNVLPKVRSMDFSRVLSQYDRAISSSELFQDMSATQRNVRSHEDDDYSNSTIKYEL